MDGNCLKIVNGKIVKKIPMTKNKGCEGLEGKKKYIWKKEKFQI